MVGNMGIYIPNFNDSRIRAFCTSAGQPISVDGFRRALISVTGASSSLSTDDLWRLFLIGKYGTFKGLHVANYGTETSFGFSTTTSLTLVDLGAEPAPAVPFWDTGFGLYYGYTAAGTAYSGGFSATNVAIPKNATIISAQLFMEQTFPETADIAGTLAAQAVDNAAAIDGTNRPSTWTVTSATATLPGAATFTNIDITITSVIQEIVNRSGWVSGNAINFRILASPPTGPANQWAGSYNGSVASLTVVYS